MLCVGVCEVVTGQTSSGTSPEDLIEAGHWKRARQIVEARLHQNPNDAQALYLASKVAEGFGDFQRAIQMGERSVSLNARNSDYLGALAQAYAQMADQSSFLRGIVYVRKLRKQIEVSLTLNPRHVDTLLVQMMYLWKAPIVAGGDRKKARSVSEQLERIDPMWGYLAQARLAQDEADDARIEKLLVRAVQANPSFYRARIELATFYCCFSHSKKLELAAREADAAKALDAGQVGAYDVLARVYASEQRWSGLDAILTESEKNVPDDLSPYYHAARVLIANAHDLGRADRYLRKYVSQEPEGRAPTIADGRKLLASIADRHIRAD